MITAELKVSNLTVVGAIGVKRNLNMWHKEGGIAIHVCFI